MTRLRRTIAAEGRDDAGITLVELMVAMTILSAVLAMFFSVLIAVTDGVNKMSQRSISNDEARSALQQIDREVRSGNVFFDPSALNGLGLRVYTQTNAPTRPTGHRCVEWRINASRLETRSWAPAPSGYTDVTGWRMVAENLVNTSSTPAFLRPTPSTLNINFLVKTGARNDTPVAISTSITGRNTQYGYPSTPCDTIPPA